MSLFWTETDGGDALPLPPLPPPSMAFVRPPVENRPPSPARSPERARPFSNDTLCSGTTRGGARPRGGRATTSAPSPDQNHFFLLPSFLRPSHETRGHFSSPWLPSEEERCTYARSFPCHLPCGEDCTVLPKLALMPHPTLTRTTRCGQTNNKLMEALGDL